MREGNPTKHGSLVSTGEIRNCLLCSRDFCDRHKTKNEAIYDSKNEAICEINHDTYYENHKRLPGVYPSLAARRSALGEQETRSEEEDLD
jgi:hypothetical protein